MPKAKHSPCISVCEHDDEGYCIGCLRTKKEVQGWRNRTEEEQLAGIEMLRERKQKHRALDIALDRELNRRF